MDHLRAKTLFMIPASTSRGVVGASKLFSLNYRKAKHTLHCIKSSQEHGKNSFVSRTKPRSEDPRVYMAQSIVTVYLAGLL